MISSLGFDCYDTVMERCLFKGQGRATVNAAILAQSAEIGQVSQRLRLVTLQEFQNSIASYFKHSVGFAIRGCKLCDEL